MPPWIANISLGLIAVLYVGCVAALLYGAYTGLVQGDVFLPPRGTLPKHLKGRPARFAGFVLLLFAAVLMLPIVQELSR